MVDPKQQETNSGKNMPQDRQGMTQDKPSHMNQGNQTFRPDQQKSQPPRDQHENPKGGQQDEERPRKAS